MVVCQEVADVHIFRMHLAKSLEGVNLASMMEILNPNSYECATLSDLNEVGDHQEHLQPVLVQGTDSCSAKPDLANEDFVFQSNLHFLPPQNFLHYEVSLLTTHFEGVVLSTHLFDNHFPRQR